MSAISLPELHELRFHPELSALASLAMAAEIARRALAVASPDDPDPLYPQLYAADLVRHSLAQLEDAVARYRALILDGDALRFF